MFFLNWLRILERKERACGKSSGAECVDSAEYYRHPFTCRERSPTENRTNDEIEQRMGKRSSAAFDVEANQINLRSRNSGGEGDPLINAVTRVFQYLACRIRRLIRYSLISPTIVYSKKEFTPLHQIYRILRCSGSLQSVQHVFEMHLIVIWFIRYTWHVYLYSASALGSYASCNRNSCPE